MKKKALLVGINVYGGKTGSLDAPEYEISQWEDLLRTTYEFRDITTLLGPNATKTAVLDGFQWLFSNAEPDDQLIFAHVGHGDTVRTIAGGKSWWDQAIVTYGGVPNVDCIIDPEVQGIAEQTNLPLGTDFTMILDACWGGFSDRSSHGEKYATAGWASDFHGDFLNVRQFGSFSSRHNDDRERLGFERSLSSPSVEQPLVVAACRSNEGAAEIGPTIRRRMAFSRRAIDFLRNNPNSTFTDLVKGITPLRPGRPQTPELRFNVSRGKERFPGEPNANPVRFAKTLASIRSAPSTHASRSLARTATVASIVNTAEVRVEGIVCLADPRNGGDTFYKRLLLPYDPSTDPVQQHVAFIEIAENDLLRATGSFLATAIEPHNGAGTLFHRWHLEGYKVEFGNVASSTPRTLSSYTTHVPPMKYGVCTGLDDHPDDLCFLTPPSKTRVAAYADITNGDVMAGPLDAVETYFITDAEDPSPWHGRQPKWVTIILPLTTDELTISLVPYAPGEPDAVITIPAGATVRFGNQRILEITETPGTPENPRDFFPLYYTLGTSSTVPLPPDLPLPEVIAGTNSCSPTNWP